LKRFWWTALKRRRPRSPEAMPPGFTISTRFLRSSSVHLTLLLLGPPGEEDPAL
jgi:hypothetical protein